MAFPGFQAHFISSKEEVRLCQWSSLQTDVHFSPFPGGVAGEEQHGIGGVDSTLPKVLRLSGPPLDGTQVCWVVWQGVLMMQFNYAGLLMS
jgi:hypothetical protein